MDLEMTGLDPAENVIVEIATLLTDDDLNLIAQGPELVIKATDEHLGRMDKIVLDMHTKSGLLNQIAASKTTLQEATEQTLAFLKEHIDSPGSVPLCGNSIGMDRRFLAVHMPEIEQFLHYRSIDVSTLKELARRWNPEILDVAPRKAVGHRALDDIKASLTELCHYRDTLFIPKGSTKAGNADDVSTAADKLAQT